MNIETQLTYVAEELPLSDDDIDTFYDTVETEHAHYQGISVCLADRAFHLLEATNLALKANQNYSLAKQFDEGNQGIRSRYTRHQVKSVRASVPVYMDIAEAHFKSAYGTMPEIDDKDIEDEYVQFRASIVGSNPVNVERRKVLRKNLSRHRKV